jgi:subtilase family serine protease
MKVPSFARLAVTISTAVVVVGALVSGAGASAASRAVDGQPAWASRSNLVRHADTKSSVRFAVVLGWNDAAGVARLAAAVSDPNSASYGHYLTPAQFHARFAQSDSAVNAVTSWLRGEGLRVGAVPANHLYVSASGTVAQVERAFGTTLNVYRVGRHLLRAPASAPMVPASLSGIVSGVVGLANTRVRHASRVSAPPPAGFRAGRPCSEYWAQKWAGALPKAYGSTRPFTPCGYAPLQVRGAYGMRSVVNSGINGQGQTVAIIDAFNAPTIRADLTTYSARHGLPAPSLKQYNVKPDPGNAADKQGWYGEETLDLEAVHSMAPGAKLVFLGAKSDFDIDILERVNFAIDNHIASIVSNSYGDAGENLPKSEIKAEEAAYQQAIAEGIGFYFSSGDCGDNLDPQGICGGTGTRATDYPASSPNITAVGGTSIGIGKGGQYLFETGWGTTASSLGRNGRQWHAPPLPGYYLYGSGGGTSKRFREPWYQQGVVPNGLAHHWGAKSGRVEPDIAALGDPNTGFLVGETQTFPTGVRYGEYRIGGTSLSSPIFAGIMALADQAAGHDLGFINPLLYAKVGGTSALHDIINPKSMVATVRTNYNNGINAKLGISFSLRTMNQTGTLHTTPGYDDVTGFGTPNGWSFINAMANG